MGLAMWTPGPLEIVIILVIVLIIFGPKRLPDLGRSLGHGMREFKDSVTGKDKDELSRSSAGTPEREPEPEPEREPATTASEQKS
jgi:sec-independent protein translocase protein TatA